MERWWFSNKRVVIVSEYELKTAGDWAVFLLYYIISCGSNVAELNRQ